MSSVDGRKHRRRWSIGGRRTRGRTRRHRHHNHVERKLTCPAVNVTPNPTPFVDDAVTDRSTSKSTVSTDLRSRCGTSWTESYWLEPSGMSTCLRTVGPGWASGVVSQDRTDLGRVCSVWIPCRQDEVLQLGR
jgi:hypothetical protein